jgi:HPt (histidine-containing phosphotransfer) domain-containing protein
MLEKLKYFINDINYTDHESLYKQAQKICHEMFSEELAHLKIDESTHDVTLAIEELGLDQELVEQLIEDYVEQVIKSIVQFEKHLRGLQELKASELRLDYTQFRELAHKNLGVARNLRVQDAQVLLYELMKKDDLDYLVTCLEALKYCTIKLHPKRAYDTIRLMEVKSSL